jgi:CheY-like chemotaxis protein
MLGKLGYEVIAEETGVGGLKLMEKQDFDLVFVDVSLPYINGIEVFRYIRVVHPYTPVVLMTGDPESKLVKQAMIFEPLSILNKPFHSADLAKIMEKFKKEEVF